VHIPELTTRLLVWASVRFEVFGGTLRGRIEFFTKSHVFDIEKASRMLGFIPRVAVSEGIGRTVLWEERLAIVSRGRALARPRAAAVSSRLEDKLRRAFG